MPALSIRSLHLGCAFVVALALAEFAQAMPAMAHAYIVQSVPAQGATLAHAPSTVTIQFDEPVELPDTPAIEVVDSAGHRVDKHDAAIDPNDAMSVVAHLGHLSSGSYSVRWRVVSADTHVVHGVYSFGYGVTAASAVDIDASTLFDPSSPLASILRGLSLTGILAAAGASSFGLIFRAPRDPAFMDAVVVQAWYGCALAAVANVGLLIVQSAASAGGLDDGMSGGGLLATLRSPFGIIWLVRVVAIGTMWACAARRRVRPALGSAAAAVALTTLTLAGHAVGASVFGWPITMALADWLHLASTSAWLGGLGVLIVGLSRSGLAHQKRRAWIARFSMLAVPAVALMMLTGIYAVLAHVSRPTLILTSWGFVLAIKVVLVVVLLLFGSQSLRAGRGRMAFSNGVLLVEAGLAVAVLLATGVLVGQALPTCMFMPGGSSMPKDTKMPPGMQICFLFRHSRGVEADVS